MSLPPMPWRSTHLDRREATVEEILDESLGIYGAQPTGHLEMAARSETYSLNDWHRVLVKDRSAVRLRSLRGSGVVVPVSMLPVTQAATRDKNIRSTRGYVKTLLSQDDYELWAGRIDALLTGQRLDTGTIRKRLEPPEAISAIVRYIIALMAVEGRVVSSEVEPAWRADGITWARWEDWLPDIDMSSLSSEAADDALVRIYLDRFGPATVTDFAWWSGITKTRSASAFARIAEPAAPADYWVTTPPPIADPPPLRLLPIWDVLFVTYRDRSRFIAPEHHDLVYDASGNATSVVLVEGKAAGVWNLGKDDSRLEIKAAPFSIFTTQQWAAIEHEAERIGKLIGSHRVDLIRCSDPPDLRTGPRNQFMSPLRDHSG